MIDDETSEDGDGFSEMLRTNSRARGRGDYWHSSRKNRKEGEFYTAKEVLTAAGYTPVGLHARPDSLGPPDCAATIDGQWCGIEITELLHKPTLKADIRGGVNYRPFPWKREDLLRDLQDRIDVKDRKAVGAKGGPYQRYFLVIVTAEEVLYREHVAEFLAASTFQARSITDAYLGLSYHPHLNSCPVFKLALVPRLA
jgi:hypothetical protein